MKLDGKITAIGYVPSDLLYVGACNCGFRRYFLTWAETQDWRDSHECSAD